MAVLAADCESDPATYWDTADCDCKETTNLTLLLIVNHNQSGQLSHWSRSGKILCSDWLAFEIQVRLC